MPKGSDIRFKFKLFSLLCRPPDVAQLMEAVLGALGRILGSLPDSFQPVVEVPPEYQAYA